MQVLSIRSIFSIYDHLLYLTSSYSYLPLILIVNEISREDCKDDPEEECEGLNKEECLRDDDFERMLKVCPFSCRFCAREGGK